jgi:hypothetical protein
VPLERASSHPRKQAEPQSQPQPQLQDFLLNPPVALKMSSLNTSTNGPSIKSSYTGVINSPAGAGSSTYGQWALYSVSAPLVNAFQQDAGGKESILKVQSTGGMYYFSLCSREAVSSCYYAELLLVWAPTWNTRQRSYIPVVVESQFARRKLREIRCS